MQQTRWHTVAPLQDNKLVVKPDQLVKRRGKHGLVAVNKTYAEVRAWIEDVEALMQSI